MIFDVYVPHPDVATGIDAQSGIVGKDLGDDTVLVDYEGNRYGATNLVTWADRLHSAAGRQRSSYPTSARQALPARELVKVGSYDDESGEVTLTEEGGALVTQWVEGDLETESRTTVRAHEQKRILTQLRAGTPSEQAMAHWYARTIAGR